MKETKKKKFNEHRITTGSVNTFTATRIFSPMNCTSTVNSITFIPQQFTVLCVAQSLEPHPNQQNCFPDL